MNLITSIYNEPINKIIENKLNTQSFRHQIELHYKSTFIYLYRCLKREINHILEYHLPKSIAYLINSYLDININDYLPLFPDIYQEVLPTITFDLMMWKSHDRS